MHVRGAFRAAGRKGLIRTAEGFLDIVLEIPVEKRKGSGEAREVPLRDPKDDGILERHDETGAERRLEKHPLAEMLSGAEHLLEMLSGLRIVDGELERTFDHRIEAVDQHAGLE